MGCNFARVRLSRESKFAPLTNETASELADTGTFALIVFVSLAQRCLLALRTLYFPLARLGRAQKIVCILFIGSDTSAGAKLSQSLRLSKANNSDQHTAGKANCAGRTSELSHKISAKGSLQLTADSLSRFSILAAVYLAPLLAVIAMSLVASARPAARLTRADTAAPDTIAIGGRDRTAMHLYVYARPEHSLVVCGSFRRSLGASWSPCRTFGV